MFKRDDCTLLSIALHPRRPPSGERSIVNIWPTLSELEGNVNFRVMRCSKHCCGIRCKERRRIGGWSRRPHRSAIWKRMLIETLVRNCYRTLSECVRSHPTTERDGQRTYEFVGMAPPPPESVGVPGTLTLTISTSTASSPDVCICVRTFLSRLAGSLCETNIKNTSYSSLIHSKILLLTTDFEFTTILSRKHIITKTGGFAHKIP